MKKILLLIVLVSVLTLQTKSQCTFGNFPPLNTATAGWTNGSWLAKKFTLSSTATLTGIGLNSAANSLTPFKMAVYTDATNTPGNFVAVSGQGAMGMGLNVLNVATPTVIPAGTYWIMAFYNAGNAPTTYSQSGTSTPVLFQTGVMSTPPVNMSAWTTGNNYDMDYWAVINSPTITVSGANTVCPLSSVTLTAGGANTYSWNTGINTSTIALSPAATTAYTISGTNGAGCTGSSTVAVNIYQLPAVSINGATTACLGSSIIHTATGASTYVWNNGTTTNTILLAPASNTSYTVTGTDSHGCVNSASVSVTVSIPPTVGVTGTNTLCLGASVTQTATGALTYVWNNGTTTNTVLLTPASNTSYTVTGTDSHGCINSASVSLVVSIPPFISVSGSHTLCSGASVSQTVSGATTYSWSTGATTNTVMLSPLVNTVYTVTGSSSNGCMDIKTISITAEPLPVLNLSLASNTICNNMPGVINVGGVISSTLNTGEHALSFPIVPGITTNYTVTGTDSKGCVNSATITQNVIVCVGIENQIQDNFSVSVGPNPGNGIYNISYTATNDNVTLSVYNASGALVKNEKINGENLKLDLTAYSSGLYYLILHNGKNQSVVKLIKE